MIRCRVKKRYHLSGTIDPHDPIGVLFHITGGDRPFNLLVITVNWGRGYDPGEFKRNVLRVLALVDKYTYVVLCIQELDEDDRGKEKLVLLQLLEPGTTRVGWDTHEPICVSPGVRVGRERKVMTMPSGRKIRPNLRGVGPDRYYVSCVIEVFGVVIGLGNQHPHRYSLRDHAIAVARKHGELVTRGEVSRLAGISDIVIDAGDFNKVRYPQSHHQQRTVMRRGYDAIRLIDKRAS